MDFTSDHKLIAGLRLQTEVFVDSLGQICSEPTNNKLQNISEVINGSIEDILHLVGHPTDPIGDLLTDGVLIATQNVNSIVSELPVRKTSSYLVRENDKLFGVIIDRKNQVNVAGIVRHVIPDPHLNHNVIHLCGANDFRFANIEEFDFHSLVSDGDIIGLIASNGHFFVQTTSTCNESQEMPELVLVLQNGFFITEKSSFVCNYAPIVGLSGGQTLSSSVSLETGDCIVTNCGGCLRHTDRYELYGSGSAIISSEIFLKFFSSLENNGSESIGSEHYIDMNELESKSQTKKTDDN